MKVSLKVLNNHNAYTLKLNIIFYEHLEGTDKNKKNNFILLFL